MQIIDFLENVSNLPINDMKQPVGVIVFNNTADMNLWRAKLDRDRRFELFCADEKSVMQDLEKLLEVAKKPLIVLVDKPHFSLLNLNGLGALVYKQ